MKNLKTILEEATEESDEFAFYARSCRDGDISLRVYFRACAEGDGLSWDEAAACLRERYQSSGLSHLCPV